MSSFIYILTNKNRTVLYTGITNNLRSRLAEHYFNATYQKKRSFTQKYNVFFLVHCEKFETALEAIVREKEIKGWRREKKDALIAQSNPEWKFKNELFFKIWPPDKDELEQNIRTG